MHFTESCHDNLAWEVFQAKMHLKWDNWETELCFCGRAMLLCRQCCLEWKILWRLSKLSVSFLSPLLGFSRSMGGFFLLSTLFTNGSLSEPSALVPPCHVANWGWDIALMCWTRFTRIAEARHTQQTCGLVENIVCMLFMLLYLHHCISKKWERKKKKVPLWILEQQKPFYYSFMPLLLSSTACFASREYLVLSGWLCSGHTKVCEQYDIPYHFECACFADRVHCYMMYALCVSFTVHFGRRVFHLKTAMLADLAVQLVCVRE